MSESEAVEIARALLLNQLGANAPLFLGTTCLEDHWVVMFRFPDPIGTASTFPPTMVLVYRTGEARLLAD